MTIESSRRPRGRPQGGGNTPEQARRILLEVAERRFVADRGTTMSDIAAGAGMTRAVLYRHFASRDELLFYVVERAMKRHHKRIRALVERFEDIGDKVSEALVYVAVEIGADPVVDLLLERDDARSRIQAVASDPGVQATLANLYAGLLDQYGSRLRAGVTPGDATRFMLGVTVMLLLRAIPGSDDPDTIRRYTRTFVLPALITDPPVPEPVFFEK